MFRFHFTAMPIGDFVALFAYAIFTANESPATSSERSEIVKSRTNAG